MLFLRSVVPDERGAAALEAALAFPFLVLFGAGLFEFGNMFYNFQLMQTGVRDAARYLARVPDPDAAEENARRLAVTGSVAPGGTARVKWWRPDQVRVVYELTANPTNAQTGLRSYRASDVVRVVRVSTSLAHEGLGLFSAAGLGTLQIRAAHAERYIGQ